MAPQVEASSLSEITQLAGNPPKYPRNPTESRRQSLTLYIARVPGSRDIILTTLKPQLKNVTAEDVAASLYYLHLNTEDDARLLQDDEGADTLTEEPEPVLQKPLPRKPLPESVRSSLELDRYGNFGGAPNLLTTVPKRKPVASEPSMMGQSQPQSNPEPAIHRRPLGPRPFGSDFNSNGNALPGIENSRPDHNGGRKDFDPKVRNSLDPGQRSIPLDHLVDEIGLNVFSITVIRRDPSSGAQWNVGTICGQPVPGEAQHRRGKHAKKPYFDMSIHLSTPGYNQFRDVSAAGHDVEGMTEVASPIGVSRRADISPVQPRSGSGFSRQLRMEGSSFWGRSSMHKRTQSDFSGERAAPRGQDPSAESSFGMPSSDSTLTGAGQPPSSKGYIFQSPWGGCCKFSTGSGGRTLRCKHSLPAPISAKTAGDFTSTPQPPSVVSELRFNLPSTSIFAPSTASDTIGKTSSNEPGRFHMSKLGHIRNKLSSDKSRHPAPPIPPRPALPPRPHPTSFAAMYPSDDEDRPPLPPRIPTRSHLRPELQQTSSFTSTDRGQLEPDLSYSDEGDEDDDRLDLSIGREKAGGGNRGKRAKLGKLIIHDEGFKMLDLAVAANMAIWWSVWEFDSR